MRDLRGKVAVVTGGASGIGYAMAARFAQEGMRLALADIEQGTLAQDEGHIVNTASLAGLVSIPGLGPYNVTKHAVVTLSETLFAELRAAGSRVGVSVLCPGFVRTRIFESERHRPGDWQRPADADPEAAKQRQALLAEVLRGAMAPEAVAERVLDAVRGERFYILTHEQTPAAVERRMRAILEGGDPPLPAPPRFVRAPGQ